MTVITVGVAGTTTPDDWVLMAGASKVAAVSSPDDEDSSYIRSPATTQTYQYFTCSPGLSAGDTITQIDVVARAKRGGASDCTFRIGYQFTPQGGGSQTGESGIGALTATSSYADHTYTHSGLSVAWGSGLVIWIRNTQDRFVSLTTLEVQITYTPVSGGGMPIKAIYYARMRGDG